MVSRRLALILLTLLLPSLAACSVGKSPEGPPPPSTESSAAITGDPGINRDDLARTIDGLFDEDAVGETRALLIMRGGLIVAERYGEGYGRATRFLGGSLSQCLTGIIVGQLVSDGRLRRDESAPVPAWQRSGDPRGEITLRQLLQMRSGLRDDERAAHDTALDAAPMLFLEGRDDMARYAQAQPLEAEPGSTFRFSTATGMILSDIAARAITTETDPDRKREATATYLRSRLLDPAGMKSFVVEYDRAGTMIGTSMVHANARDWGRLGEFIRNGGSVKGAQIVPRRWVEFMRAPSSRNPGFGALVWLNRPQSDGSTVLFPGKAPESLFGCVGELGQYVVGSPSQKLTVIRLGHTTDDKRDVLRSRLGDLVALFPSRQT